MIIACPSCNARYKVKDELIKEKGKKVKCKKCSAIFKAFRDQDSVLLKAAPGQEDALKTQQVDSAAASAGIKVSVGAQAQAAPSQPAKDEPVTSQATVRVDRSKLQDYMKQAQHDQPPPPPSLDAFKQDPEDDFPLGNLDQHGGDETVRVDPSSFAPTGGQDAGATMAVDRNQIDQFLKQQVNEEEDDPLGNLAGEDDPPDAGATMAFDRSQIDAMMKSGQDEEEDLLGLGNVDNDAPSTGGGSTEEAPPDAGATMAVDRSQLDAFLNQNQAPGEDDPFATREAPPALETDSDSGDAAGGDKADDSDDDDFAGDSGATMAMDRSQLDAFLKQNQPPSSFETQETESASTEEETALDGDDADSGGSYADSGGSYADAGGSDAGATMAVDRSQIDAFLQQNSTGEEPSDMLGLENDSDDDSDDDSDVGATMAVDRSQIDAFLEQNQPPAPPTVSDDDSLTFDESPDTGPVDDEVGATVAMDRSQLDAFLSKAQEEQTTGEENPFADTPAFDAADQGGSFADEPAFAEAPAFDGADQDSSFADEPAFDTAGQDDPASDSPNFGDDLDDPFADDFPTNEATKTMGDPDVIDDAPVSEPDPLDVAAHQGDTSDPFHAEITPPGFPSDDELGIADEAAALDQDPATPGQSDPYATVVSDEPPDFNDIDPSDFGDDPPPPPPPSDTIPHLDAEQNAQIQAEGALWQAWIDEDVYPDLTLETLERWVIEDRLLETDRLAPAGTEDFKRAEEIPEVAAFFVKYNKSGPSQAAAAPAKKGFFGWLKSLFKK